MLTITVVTPSYNQGKFIQRTLDSVLSQDYPILEYLVFDGGSSDETLDILKSYSDNVKWISEKDRGQAHAINKGLEAAKGDVIGWLNSDDIYYPGAVKKVMAYFEENPAVDLVYGEANHIDEIDGIIEKYYTEPWDLERFKDVCFISQPAAFFRRRVVEKLGLLDVNLHFCLDYEYWLRIALSGGKINFLPDFLAGSRLYQTTKTLGQPVRFHQEINDMLYKKLGYVPEAWIFNYAHAVLDAAGVPRSQRLRFSVLVSLASYQAAWRWNKKIPASMLKTTFRWVRGNLKAGILNWSKP
jgi:glycosyltransferase involved in cell wall biosynthesis